MRQGTISYKVSATVQKLNGEFSPLPLQGQNVTDQASFCIQTVMVTRQSEK